MSVAKLESLGEGRFRVSGSLDAVTVVHILADSNKVFAPGAQIEIDLDGVTDSDSAGLALLLEWLRLGRIKEQIIRFRNLPPQIAALARISEVEDLFGVSEEVAEHVPPAASALG